MGQQLQTRPSLCVPLGSCPSCLAKQHRARLLKTSGGQPFRLAGLFAAACLTDQASPKPLLPQHSTKPHACGLLARLQEITGGRSVPRVFVGGKFIGGGDDTDVSAWAGLSRLSALC